MADRSSDSLSAVDASDPTQADDSLKPGLAGDDDTAPSPLSELSAPDDDDDDNADSSVQQDQDKDGRGLGHDADNGGRDSASRDGGSGSSPPHPNGIGQKPGAGWKTASPSGFLPPHDQNSATALRHMAVAPSSSQTSKVAVLLEINAELFKACNEFLARSIPQNSSPHSDYQLRLKSNLTWMAAAVDSPIPRAPTPIFAPPPSVDFLQTDRLSQLYAELSSLFEKSFQRGRQQQQQHFNQQQQQQPPHQQQLSTGSLKRDRPPDHATPEPTNKRRDTGESKTPLPMLPPPGTPRAPVPPHTPVFATPAPPPPSRTPQLHASPSVPPQNFPMSQGNAAAVAAEARNRAQQLAMRQQLQQQQALQAQQAGRQASPAQMHPPQHVPGTASQQQLQQIMQHYGQNGIRLFQVLQNPGSPFVQHMIKMIPNFMTLPLHQQLDRMVQMQKVMAQKQQQQQQQQQQQVQQQQQAQQHQSPPGMSLQGVQGPSVLPQRSPTLPLQQGSPTHGGFPPAGGMPQQQLMSMPLQQRQMFFMQQQQRMSNGLGGQQAQQPQPQPQQQSTPTRIQHPSSPMHVGSPDTGAFAGLGGGIPGIARRTRSPSESAPSPMTPRTGGSQQQQDFHRMMAMHTGGAGGGMGTPSPAGQGFVNPAQMMAGGGMAWGAGAGGTGGIAAMGGGGYGATPPSSAHDRTTFGATAPSPDGWGTPGSFSYAPSPVQQQPPPQQPQMLQQQQQPQQQQQQPPSFRVESPAAVDGMEFNDIFNMNW